MNAPLRRIVLMPNTTKCTDPQLIQDLVLRMQASGGYIVVPEECRSILGCVGESVAFVRGDEIFSDADVIFVLGGDGSIIDAARRSIGYGIPIAGVNLGRLGYLAEIEGDELEFVDRILAGDGTIEERIMLDACVIRGDSVMEFRTPALNDVVLSNGPVPRLLSFELYCDGKLAEHCYADGIILSTPTGSTAYSLSAGGPVLDPCLDCICSTPICPQTMNNRPVIFRGESTLELCNIKCRGNTAYLSLDGRESIALEAGDSIQVRRSSHKTKLIRIKNDGFLNALRRKLS